MHASYENFSVFQFDRYGKKGKSKFSGKIIFAHKYQTTKNRQTSQLTDWIGVGALAVNTFENINVFLKLFVGQSQHGLLLT